LANGQSLRADHKGSEKEEQFVLHIEPKRLINDYYKIDQEE